MEALSREFRVGCPWELLYADNLAILSDSLVDLKNILAAWKTSVESHGLRINLGKTKIPISSAEHPKFQQGIQSTLVVYVPLVLALTLSYALRVICGFIVSVQEELITLLATEILCAGSKCSGEIVPAAIASFKEVNIGNDSFHVEPTFNYFGDTIGQCGGCSDVVSTRIVSSWKAF